MVAMLLNNGGKFMVKVLSSSEVLKVIDTIHKMCSNCNNCNMCSFHYVAANGLLACSLKDNPSKWNRSKYKSAISNSDMKIYWGV